MSYKIYKHTLPDGRAYIGMTSKSLRERWKYGWGYMEQKNFFEEIMKNGWNNIQHEILEEVKTETEAREREAYYIKLYETHLPEKGFNIHGKNQEVKKKKVFVCVETGEVFNSLKAAGAAVGRGASAISMAATHGTTCAKFHWRIDYVEI